ncbi:MAG: ZIP family metal transporter [candidate division Zixibacteria bacterium]|nr:ZIP family metal transporter [candidate division Zixibacteria bacterium]
MDNNVFTYCIIIFLSALLGGFIAIAKKWSDEYLHLFLSFGAGIFLGMVFLHLLPEVLAHKHDPVLSIMVLAGFMFIFIVERILFISSDGGGYDHSHKIISLTAMLGLSVHSIIGGVGLAVGSVDQNLGWLIFISIISHKMPASFALTSLFVLGKFSKKRIWLFLILFSLMTPLGALAFAPIVKLAGSLTIEILTAFTAGTFLYVATADILPEVFHTREKKWIKLLLLIIGIIVISFIGFLDIHVGGH